MTHGRGCLAVYGKGVLIGDRLRSCVKYKWHLINYEHDTKLKIKTVHNKRIKHILQLLI